MSAHEYDSEPIPGLPGIPPAGERILWQGSPQWRAFLVHVLHVRWVLAYFGALTAWRFVAALGDGLSVPSAVTSALWLMPLWASVVAALGAFAVASARSTIYTLTTQRLILRFGVALPMAVNVPFRQVVGASLAQFADGSGQVALELDGEVRLAYLVIWPHTRPGLFLNPQPMLRGLAAPEAVGKRIADALAAYNGSVSTPAPLAATSAAGSRPLKPMAGGLRPAAAE